MQVIFNAAKKMSWLIVLFAVLGGAAVHAQRADSPKIVHVEVSSPAWPGRAMILWNAPPDARTFQVYVRGFGDEWAPRDRGGKGGWYNAEGKTYHRVFGLMPGNRYNIRIRTFGEDGYATKPSDIFPVLIPPCWVFARYEATGEKWVEEDSRNPLQPPPEWAHIENTLGCE